jgi:hypothetical protein
MTSLTGLASLASMRSLTRVERSWARATLEAIYPARSCDALPLGIGDLDVEGFLADLLRRIPLTSALGLRVAIWIVALAPIFLLRRFVTVNRLGSLEQQAIVLALLSSSIYAVRQLVTALKATGGLLYGAAASVRNTARGESLESSGERLVAPHSLARRAKEKSVDDIVA